ncbi:sushi domain-containing protein 1 isoform X3 [Chelmon rostratus]|uniref:sushi domain-containing protein 1 isoform X3 n=1 Tax=Chelmon rostratus TaxID=109905 RepID=UPI001BE992E4|nr:sushi domain-containing protein 1 isoform X3 [Chelmon rostratus]
MDEGHRKMIVVFLLCVIADMPAESNTLDVCATCHANATCDDKSDGSGKVCNCKYGFVGNGRTFCQDKDECQIGASKICGQHATCHNTYSSYYCTCQHGYSPSNDMAVFIPNDGTHCQDTDECRITGLCGEGGQCRNLEGSFDCSCQLGYQVHNGEEPFHPHTDKAFCKAKCGPVPFLANSEVAWHNRSVVIHRCVDGYHSWRGSNVSVCASSGLWQKATLRCIEIKPPISRLFVLNEKCLHWRAEKYEEDTEVYKVTYIGSRDYQSSFHDKRKRFLSSKADQLDLCLNLLPVTNYSISITAVSARFTATITTNTSLPAPPAPIVYYREFETPVPTLRLRRSHNTLDPISLYQVFVLPIEGIMMFDCSSPVSSNTRESSKEYITGQIDVRHVGTEMNFTVGDGLYYGGFLNAPLEKGRNYYIILRAVSQWKTALKSSCVLWAKVRGTSYILRVSSLSAAASIGLVALAIAFQEDMTLLSADVLYFFYFFISMTKFNDTLGFLPVHSVNNYNKAFFSNYWMYIVQYVLGTRSDPLWRADHLLIRH